MKIALFGGSGFVGSNLLSTLQKKNYDVFEISRAPISDKSFRADISQWNELEKIDMQFDIVVICSSRLPQQEYNTKDLFDFVNINIIGVNNILLWSKERKVSKIIFSSTLSFLPCSDSQDETELIDIGSHYMYKVSKASAEHFLIGFCKSEKIDFCSLRIASVYGVGMKKDILFNFTSKIIKGEKIFLENSNLTADFIHIDDVIKVIVKCIENSVPAQVLNVASGNPTSLIDLITLIGKLLNVSSLPEMIIKSSKPINQKRYSAQKMKKMVSDRVPLSEGLNELIKDWYANSYF